MNKPPIADALACGERAFGLLGISAVRHATKVLRRRHGFLPEDLAAGQHARESVGKARSVYGLA